MTTSAYRQRIALCAAVFILCISVAAWSISMGDWFNYVLAVLNLINGIMQIYLIIRWLRIYRNERGFK
jgi:uncharacterized membrane protein